MALDNAMIFAAGGVAVFCLSLYGLFIYGHLLRRILALNIMASAVFLFLGSVSRHGGEATDPVPRAMVITGIVVTVAVTAFAVALARRIHAISGKTHLPEDREHP